MSKPRVEKSFFTDAVVKLSSAVWTGNRGSNDNSTSTSKSKPSMSKKFENDFIDLLEGKKAGHMGKYCFSNGGMEKFEQLIDEHPEYYVATEEQALIERCAQTSASLIDKNQKITLVSRGPGMRFDAKEGALIRAFLQAGIEIEKVVYIDNAQSALDQSVEEGEALLPDAQHQAIRADIFNSKVLKKYTVEGLEVGTCFGLTPMNAEGRSDATPPLSSVEKNLSAVRQQMTEGAHFIAVYDHNDNANSLESAYAPADKFLKNMLTYYFDNVDLDGIEYVNKFNSNSCILGHAYEFNKDMTFMVGGKPRAVNAGIKLWFNNSVKLSRGLTEQCNEDVGFRYPMEERVIMSEKNRLGYHHTLAT